jgi:PhnB protein
MQVSPYLSFRGDCEAALTFYAECLDGKLGQLHRYGGTPMADQAPPGWENKVMHGTVAVAGLHLMAADVAREPHEKPQGFSLAVNVSAVAEADRYFSRLAQGGTIVMPLEKTFWATRFGMLVDKFGISWMVNCEGAE